MLTPRFVATVLLALATAGSLAAQPSLSGSERKIVAAAKAENARALAFLETLVNINSGTMNLQGVEQVGRLMIAELEPLGFEVRWIPMTAVGRAGHIVAEHKGSGRGKRMLLIGHLDTVFEKDSPFQKFERRGDTAEGPGVNDMKDGLSIMVAALRALQKAGALEECGHHHRAQRRRGTSRQADVRFTRGHAERGGPERRGPRVRVAGSGRRPRHGLDRPTQQHQLDGAGEGQVRPLLRHVLRDCRLRGRV